MRRVVFTRAFEKDVKLMKKRGRDMTKLRAAMQTLAETGNLEERFKDHSLRGNYQGYRECHLEPDWLLIYKITDEELSLSRAGTHSDLF
jgi:mRNA interferase YafQ